MAQLGQTFDATSVDPDSRPPALPAGEYKAHVVESSMEATKSGNGQKLVLQFEVLDGQFHGRRVFCNLNLVNPSTQAVEIAQKQLSAICHAVGVMAVQDSEQLHFKPMLIGVKTREYEGETYNDIKSFKPLGGNPATAHVQPAQQPAPGYTQAAQQQSAPQTAAASNQPWKRSA